MASLQIDVKCSRITAIKTCTIIDYLLYMYISCMHNIRVNTEGPLYIGNAKNTLLAELFAGHIIENTDNDYSSLSM